MLAKLAELAELHAGSADGEVALTSWAVGFVGERLVGDRLGSLGGSWRVLHAVPLGRRGKDVDHLVIGPPGLFVINTKHHEGVRIAVKGGDALYLSGVWKPYLKDARRDAGAVQDQLRPVLPEAVAVHAVVCTVGAKLAVASPADAVTVLDVDALVPWLDGHQGLLDPAQVDQVFTYARRPDVWPGKPVPAAAAAVADLAERLATIQPPAAAAGTDLPPDASPRPRRTEAGTSRRSRPGPSQRRTTRPRPGRSRTTGRPGGSALVRIGVGLGILAALWLLGAERITALLHR